MHGDAHVLFKSHPKPFFSLAWQGSTHRRTNSAVHVTAISTFGGSCMVSQPWTAPTPVLVLEIVFFCILWTCFIETSSCSLVLLPGMHCMHPLLESFPDDLAHFGTGWCWQRPQQKTSPPLSQPLTLLVILLVAFLVWFLWNRQMV